MRDINNLLKFNQFKIPWVLTLNDNGLEIIPYKKIGQLQRFKASLGFGPLSLFNIAKYIESHPKEAIQAIEKKKLDSAIVYKELIKTIKKHNGEYSTIRKIDPIQQSFFNSLPIESKLKIYASKILDQNDLKNIQKIFHTETDVIPKYSTSSLITLIKKIEELDPFDQKDELIKKIRSTKESLEKLDTNTETHTRHELLIEARHELLIEAAKLDLKTDIYAEDFSSLDPWTISKFIETYAIDLKSREDQRTLIEIAKLAAQENGHGTSQWIEVYGIDSSTKEGKSALREIARLAAQHCGEGTSYYIQSYGIDSSTEEGQKSLIEIAKSAAKQSGLTVAHIKNYGIDSSSEEGRKSLIEIAELAAHHSVRCLLKNIKNFGFNPETKKGKQAIIEIAKLAAEQNGKGTSKYLNNCGIQDRSTLSYLSSFIFEAITLQLPVFRINKIKEQYTYLENKSDNIKPRLADPFIQLFEKKVDNAVLFKNICQELISKGWLYEQDLTWFIDSYKKIKDEFNQKRFLDWFGSLAAICMMKDGLIEVLKNHSLLTEIAKRDPILRTALTKELILLHCENRYRVKKATEKSDKRNDSTKSTPLVLHAELASLVFSRFPRAKGFHRYSNRAFVKALTIIKSEREFREGSKQKLLIETLRAIKNCPLGAIEKTALINGLFKMKLTDRLIAFGLVKDLISFDGTSYLKEYNIEGYRNGLSTLFQDRFQVQVDSFAKKYESTIGCWRKKEALITYVGKLNELSSLEKKDALGFLQQVITWILEGNFSEKRYEITHNPHLAIIAEKHPEIFKKWQISLQLKPEEMIPAAEKKEDFALQKIKEAMLEGLRNNHLGLQRQAALYPTIAEFILSSTHDAMKFIEKVEMNLEHLRGRKTSQEETEQKKALLIEKAILEIFKLNNEEEVVKKLNIIKSILPKENEFNKTDISGCLNLLTEKDIRPQTYETVDTDDPNDILLMGTEVENSCQRVDGSPDLNKCLLGYFIDGKHRLLLVKDAENKIVARSVIRLLVDKKNNPVIFQERVYVADSNPEYLGYLRKLAIKKARELRVPLVTTSSDFKNEFAKRFFSPVYAYDKPVPFEYVDALRGKESVHYVINNILEINSSE